MTTEDPDRLRGQIEHTQRNLSSNVDLLAEKVTPSRVIHRRMGRARHAVHNLRERVMGSTSDTTSSVADAASSAADRASTAAGDAVQTAGQAAREAPQAVRRGAQGNPIAAGLIAFGAGWLISTLVPASKAEEQLAQQATTWAQEHSEPLKEEVGHVAEELKENLREPAERAAESVRSTATDAADTVRQDVRSAADEVGDRTQQARESVQDNRS
jgi:gas vesicle protein